MSRIERMSRRSYAKIPTATEQKIINIVNNYFSSTNNECNGCELSEEDKQIIMNEIVIRLYPVINQISSTVAEGLIQEAIQRLIAELITSNNNVTSVEYVVHNKIIEASDPKDRVIIPYSKLMLMNKGDLIVTVNGIEQEYFLHYRLVPDLEMPSRIGYISFGDDVLEVGDEVNIEWLNHFFLQQNRFKEVIEEDDDYDTVLIPLSSRMDLLVGNMMVLVNGQLQEPIEHFNYILHPNYSTLVTGVQFKSLVLQVGDVVTVILEYRPQAMAIEFNDIIDSYDNKRIIDIPWSKQIQTRKSRICVLVNGQRQGFRNYNIIPDDDFPAKAGSIDFKEFILEEDDIVHVIA